ncbi:FEKKY domain-containing protein [Pontibacter sp. CAU 1760]
MKKRILLLLIPLLPLAALAQGQTDLYSISGKVNLLIGLDIVPAQEALVTVKNTGQATNTDSLGNFKLENIAPGKHHLQIIGFSVPVIDTTVTITNAPVTGINLLARTNCVVNQDVAYRDIKYQRPRLLLVGGIAPVVYANQQKFEQRYDVAYHDFGCVAPNEKCIALYNKVVFEYLDKRYGRKWRKEVRKDVIGL